MFAERLQDVLNCIDATNKDIAEYAGFDRTNISHLRSGRRTAKPSGATTEKLIEGICIFAKKNDKTEALRTLIGAKEESSHEDLKSALTSWLFEGAEHTVKPAAAKEKKRRSKMHSFGERLETAMELASVSNIRLSKLVHTDASLISRYRKGLRTPYSNPELLNHLCLVLYERIQNVGRINELADCCGVPSEEFDEEDFYNWLYDRKDHQEENILVAESLLGSFDSYQVESSIVLPALDDVLQSVDHEDHAATYFGQDGIRAAVLRFLSNAVKEKVPELMLYSDEDQSWLTEDLTFRLKWAALMSACVKNGTRIRIIHNIDRDLSEMHQAITSWLPLYMSGMIESWYSKKGRDRRFSHTIFLSPERECIKAFHVVGNEPKGLYHYYTDMRSLETCQNAFNLLLANANPLINPSSGTGIDANDEIFLIQGSLSLATMPEALIMEINDPVITEKWHIAHEDLISQLRNGIINECIPLATDESLFSGEVPLEPVDGTNARCYTPEQYALHVQNILDLLERHPNYHFVPLPAAPFPNMKLQLTKTESQITHIIPPQASFSFRHQLMCSAFCDYARSLIQQHKMDRHVLNDKLTTLL